MPTIQISAVILLDPDRRLLLVRKRGTTSFIQPGGKPEPGEQPLEAAVREVSEELGLHLSPERLRFVGRFDEQAANEPDHRVAAHAFSALLTAEEATSARHAAEIEEARWVTISEAEELPLAPLTRHHFLPLVTSGITH